MSKHLINYYLQENWKVDIVVPIPLSLSRQSERGYNQAGLLAWPLALALGIYYQPKAISRIRETRPQVGLKAHERAENVKGAFSANEKLVEGKTILIIDDVTTTGATLSASAQAAIEAGAERVFGLTLARSSFRFEPEAFQAA